MQRAPRDRLGVMHLSPLWWQAVPSPLERFWLPMRKISTPWGLSDQSKQIADGIVFHSTPSHGGFELSSERSEALQRKFKFNTFAGGKWYEEDCDACAVVIAFPTPAITGAAIEPR